MLIISSCNKLENNIQDTPVSTLKLYEKSLNSLDQSTLDLITTERFWEVAAINAESMKYFKENGLDKFTFEIKETKQINENKVAIIVQMFEHQTSGNIISESPFSSYILIKINNKWYLDYIE